MVKAHEATCTDTLKRPRIDLSPRLRAADGTDTESEETVGKHDLVTLQLSSTKSLGDAQKNK